MRADSTVEPDNDFKWYTPKNIATDVVGGVIRGAAEGLTEAVTLPARAVVDFPEIDFSPANGFNSPLGDLSKGAGQFLSVFLPTGKVAAVGKVATRAYGAVRALEGYQAAKTAAGASKLVTGALKAAAGTARAVGTTNMGRSFAQGAVADFLAFGETEQRLSNLVQSWDIPVLSGVVGYTLAAEDDDGWLQGRLKNVVEGGALGIAVDAFFAGAKKLKGSLTAKTNEKGLQEIVVKDSQETLELLENIQREVHEAGLQEAMARAGVTNFKELGEGGVPTYAILPGRTSIVEGGSTTTISLGIDVTDQDRLVAFAFKGTESDVQALRQFAIDTKNEKLGKLVDEITKMKGSSTWQRQQEAAAAAKAEAADMSDEAATDEAVSDFRAETRGAGDNQEYKTALEVNAGLKSTDEMKPIVESRADADLDAALNEVANVRVTAAPVTSAEFAAISKEHAAYENDVLKPLLDSRAITESDAAIIRAAMGASDMWFQQVKSLSAREGSVPGAFGQADLGTGQILINGARVRDARTRRANGLRPVQGAVVVLHETMHISLHRAPETVQLAAKMAWMGAKKSGYIDAWVANTFKELPDDARAKLLAIYKSNMDEFIVEHSAWMLTKRGSEAVPEGYLQTIAGFLGQAIKVVMDRVREFMGNTPNESLDSVTEMLAGLKEIPEFAAARKRAARAKAMKPRMAENSKLGIETRKANLKAAQEERILNRPTTEAEEIQAKFDRQDEADRTGKADWKRKSVDPEEEGITINLSALADRLKGKKQITVDDVADAIELVGGNTIKSLSRNQLRAFIGSTEQLMDVLLSKPAYVSNKLSQAMAAKASRAVGPDNRVVQATQDAVNEAIERFIGTDGLPNTAIAPLLKRFILDGLNSSQKAFKTWAANPKSPEAQEVLVKSLGITVNNINLLAKFRNESGRVLQSHSISPADYTPKLGQFGANEQIARLEATIEAMVNDPDFLRSKVDRRFSVDPETAPTRMSSVRYENLPEAGQMAVREARRQVMKMLESTDYDPTVFISGPWKDSLKLTASERLVLVDILREEVGSLPAKNKKEFTDELFKMVVSEVKDMTPETAAFVRNVLDMDSIDDDSLAKLAGMMEAAGTSKSAARHYAKMIKAASQEGKEGRTLFDKYMEVWMNSILSGPRTFVTNIVSSALATVARPAEIVIGGAVTANTKVMSQGIKEYVHLIHTLFDIVKGADATDRYMTTYQSIKQTFKSGRNEFDAGSSIFDGPVNAIEHPILGNIVRLPMKTIAATDELFKQLNMRSMLRGRAIREFERLGKPPQELESFIRDFMEEAFEPGTGRLGIDPVTKRVKHQDLYASTNALTFTEPLSADLDWVSKVGLALSEVNSAIPAARMILPFVRTPTNILRKTLALTPFAPTMKSFRDRLSGHMGEVEKAKAVGEMVLGSSIMGLAAAAAASGVITGYGPRNDNERRLWLDSGAKPYSFRIQLSDGSYRYIEYRKFDPVATHMGMIADMVDYVQTQMDLGDHNAAEHGGGILSALVFAVTANVTNKSYLMGVRDFFDAATDLSDSGVLERYVGQRVFASHIPAIVGSMPAFDDFTKEIQGMMDPLWNRVPGLNQQLPVRRNVLGEPIRNPNLARMVPVTQSVQQADPVMEELNGLGYGFQRMPFTFKGVDLREYYDSEGRQAYDKMTELSGTVKIGNRTLKESLQELIENEQYQSLPKPIGVNDHENYRVKAIQSIMQKYRMKARDQVLKDFPEVNQKVRENSGLANPRGVQSGLSKL